MIYAISLLNSIQRYFSSHILLYHSTYNSIPNNLKEGIHNVSPDTLYRQIKWFKKYFDVVEVDQLFVEDMDFTGKVAITFDDGYQSVFKEAVPVIESLNIPCTIFINGVTVNGKPFWRDKVRFLINNSLVTDFLKSYNFFCASNKITAENFYRRTKSPEINSKIIDKMCDEFIEKQQIAMSEIQYCINDLDSFIEHPLISYGNHTFSHYVLSSLSEEEQEKEIKSNHELLSKTNVKLSKIFSIPFGGNRDFNLTTVKLIEKYKYTGFLYSRGAVNINFLNKNQRLSNFSFRERYMVPSGYGSFQKRMTKLFIKSVFNNNIKVKV
jgi:peptidoglycan/xylan/chitin deacetylase (PgdA/CDA1 family)